MCYMTALLAWNWIERGSVVLDSGSRGFFCTLIDCWTDCLHSVMVYSSIFEGQSVPYVTGAYIGQMEATEVLNSYHRSTFSHFVGPVELNIQVVVASSPCFVSILGGTLELKGGPPGI
jgi:hypothetical protein